MKRIEIYGRPGNAFCSRAIALCESRQVKFVYRDVNEAENLREMRERASSGSKLPQIFIGNHHVGSLEELEALPIHHLQQMIGE